MEIHVLYVCVCAQPVNIVDVKQQTIDICESTKHMHTIYMDVFVKYLSFVV